MAERRPCLGVLRACRCRVPLLTVFNHQVCAILSSFFLNEKLSLFGWLGCALCILGSTVIALNGPEQHASGQIEEFKKLFIAPGFLAWTGICIATALVLIFFVVPKYGKKTMLVHITICSVIGGLSVSVTSGLGSAILLSIRGTNQFVSGHASYLAVMKRHACSSSPRAAETLVYLFLDRICDRHASDRDCE